MLEEVEAIRKELEEIKSKIEELAEKIEKIPSRMPDKEVEGVLTEEQEEKLNFSKLQEKEVVELVVPLAHAERVKILKNLAGRGKYFTELLSELGMSHSPLYFHLNILQKAGYVNQEYARGRYLITELGLRALKFLAQLYDSSLRREER